MRTTKAESATHLDEAFQTLKEGFLRQPRTIRGVVGTLGGTMIASSIAFGFLLAGSQPFDVWSLATILLGAGSGAFFGSNLRPWRAPDQLKS